MKKIIFLFILAAFCCLSGCNNSTNQSITDLKTKVDQLEQDLVDLQTQANDAASKTVDNSDPDSVTDTFANMEGLTASVNKLVDKVSEVVPTGSDSNRMGQYFELKNQLKQQGKKIDAYDANLEIQYKQEELNYTDYRIQEREAQALHNTLNDAEDKLRLKFRMDE